MFSKDQLKQLAPKLQKVEEDRLAQRYEYLGLLSEYQLYLKEPKQNLIYSKLNPKQHFLFKRILHGLKMYKQDEISKMHWDKKRRIIKVWKRAQNVINKWKQLVCHKDATKIFSKGDTVYLHDVDTALGTVKSVSATSIELNAAIAGGTDLADDDELVNANPIKIKLGFEQ